MQNVAISASIVFRIVMPFLRSVNRPESPVRSHLIEVALPFELSTIAPNVLLFFHSDKRLQTCFNDLFFFLVLTPVALRASFMSLSSITKLVRTERYRMLREAVAA